MCLHFKENIEKIIEVLEKNVILRDLKLNLFSFS